MDKLISGKVREVYKVSPDQLVIVTTDRISAFDVILSGLVPDKGKVLNTLALHWFDITKGIVPNHIISSNLKDMPEYFQNKEFEERTVLVKRLNILPFEFVVRGYMFGSMWESYNKDQSFCGQNIPSGYRLAQKLEKPFFTPSTKAQTGHDEYLPFNDVKKAIGKELADNIQDICFRLYEMCYNYAYERGIIIADTKFEFGLDKSGNLFIADEIFTPDCSRFWNSELYEVGVSPKSYDKQFIRDWLQNNKINGELPFDSVPLDILLKTAEIYKDCLRKLK